MSTGVLTSSKHSCVYPPGSTPSVTLGYWAIRGLAQPIRYLLAYAGIPFEDIRYQQGDESTQFDISAWLTDKAANAWPLDFPNLPFFIDGPTRITQSNAILRTIGRKSETLGNGPHEQAIVDMLIEEAYDFRNSLMIVYNPDYLTLLGSLAQRTVPNTANKIAKVLGDKEFLVGSKPTVPDFVFFELFMQVELMLPGCLAAYPTLLAHIKRMCELPAIAKYRQDQSFIERPVNNTVAQFK